ncbi:glycoside hydrolase family 3 C-terminal domain-containing protein [Paenibacillus sp. CAU 1523]|uniref:beta-glucosidase n=2 Tax=Paenibacillus arenosi TaxID=2774142 RepID=A0ABR9ASB3_9BACL|nr:glycoside hydrolase family 3 C-terminal domain-containing protein [Paenibacillus arenosi]
MVNRQKMVDLLKQMTLEEKIAQLLQLAAPFYDGADSDGVITGPMKELGITEDTVRQAGSALGLAGAEKIKHIQQTHLKNNRLGIPLLFMADIIHGFKTIFPIPLAIGCSWDLELAEKSAEVAAKEAAVSGVHVTFAPMVDLVRDPRWGRVMESTGEDPYLNSMFARAFVRGFQGDDLTNDVHRVAACVKHFAAYGLAEGGRDYNTVDLSERQLREYYLPAYKAALDEGCEMVMTSFNTVDSIPATANRKLMRNLLRDEWGFDGVLISDWAAIKELIPHGVAANEEEAAYKAIQAGVDIEMMTSTYVHHMPDLIASGKVDEALIDEAVLRVLLLKEKLGLFDNPLRGADPEVEREVVFSQEHRSISREMAAKSCVLLKNEGGVLPLQRSSRIALIGPFAKNNDILGNWSWTGVKDDAVRLDQALSAKISDSLVAIAEGSSIELMTEEQYSEALSAAEQADVIVLALGEHSDMSGEGGCRADIKLPQAQLELIARLKQLDKPIVAVLFNGRPLDLHGVYDQVDGLLEAWYPGSEGGAAIAELLYGDVNPSGRLTMSFPYSVGQVPVYYNQFNTGRPHDPKDVDARYVSRYLDAPNAPLLPFGYGLSYTSFVYGELVLSEDIMTVERPLHVEVMVTNTGERSGEEVVQLYVRDIAGDVVRPLKELKHFAKISLEPGESRRVTFTITEEDLRYHHADLQFTSDPGEFAVFVGSNSRDVMERRFHFVQ